MRYRIKKNGLQLVLNELQTIILIVELLNCKTPNSYILHRRCSRYEPSVDAAAYAEEEYACGAEGEGYACSAVALERSERSIGLVDVHALYNLQVVVE